MGVNDAKAPPVITESMLRHSERVVTTMEWGRRAKMKETSRSGPYAAINHEICTCWAEMQ